MCCCCATSVRILSISAAVQLVGKVFCLYTVLGMLKPCWEGEGGEGGEGRGGGATCPAGILLSNAVY